MSGNIVAPEDKHATHTDLQLGGAAETPLSPGVFASAHPSRFSMSLLQVSQTDWFFSLSSLKILFSSRTRFSSSPSWTISSSICEVRVGALHSS